MERETEKYNTLCAIAREAHARGETTRARSVGTEAVRLGRRMAATQSLIDGAQNHIIRLERIGEAEETGKLYEAAERAMGMALKRTRRSNPTEAAERLLRAADDADDVLEEFDDDVAAMNGGDVTEVDLEQILFGDGSEDHAAGSIVTSGTAFAGRSAAKAARTSAASGWGAGTDGSRQPLLSTFPDAPSWPVGGAGKAGATGSPAAGVAAAAPVGAEKSSARVASYLRLATPNV